MANAARTGYPSIDKPWLKYYSEEAINAPLPECTMYEYIWKNNKDHLSDIALRYYGTKITYGKLFERIKKAASALYAMGVRKGDVVTIMSLHTPETIICIYALNYLGAAANMVYMTLSPKELSESVKNTGSKLLVVLDVTPEQAEHAAKAVTVPVVALSIADSMPIGLRFLYRAKRNKKGHGLMSFRSFLRKGVSTAPMACDAKATAIIVYTSGTTGEPKGVKLSSRNINAVAFQYRNAGFSFERGDTMLVFMPPFLSIGLSLNVHMPLILGLTLIECADPAPDNLVRNYTRNRPNHFFAAPTNIVQIMESGLEKLTFVKTIGAGGEAISAEDERRVNAWLERGGSKARYMCGYGMTELSATVTTSNNRVNREETLGVPLARCNVKVIHPDTGAMLPYGETGELCFTSPSQMQGYLNGDTSVFHVDDAGVQWIRTGDLGFVDTEGFVHYVGRIKRIGLCKGEDGTLYKLFPQRIEECLESHPGVQQCGVLTIPDAVKLSIPIAFVALRPGISADETIKALTELSCRELPSHMQPMEIRTLETMPMTASGKIDYRTLEKLMADNQ